MAFHRVLASPKSTRACARAFVDLERVESASVGRMTMTRMGKTACVGDCNEKVLLSLSCQLLFSVLSSASSPSIGMPRFVMEGRFVSVWADTHAGLYVSGFSSLSLFLLSNALLSFVSSSV